MQCGPCFPIINVKYIHKFSKTTVGIYYHTIKTPATGNVKIVNYTFQTQPVQKKTVIIGSANHMAKSMSVLDQEQLLKCFIWQRSVMKTVYLNISKKDDLLSLIGFEKQ